MEHITVVQMIERMKQGEEFCMGDSLIVISEAYQQADGTYFVRVPNRFTITGDANLMLGVTSFIPEVEEQAELHESNRMYEAGYAYACGYHD